MCLLTEAFNIIGSYFNNTMAMETLNKTIKSGMKHVNFFMNFKNQVLERRQAHVCLENLIQSLRDDGKNYFFADETLRLFDSKMGSDYINRHDSYTVNILLHKARELNLPLLGMRFKTRKIPRKYFNANETDQLSRKNRQWMRIFASHISDKHPTKLNTNQIFDRLITTFKTNNYAGRYRIYKDTNCNVFQLFNMFFYRTNYLKFTIRAGDTVLYRDSNNTLSVAQIQEMYLLENYDEWLHINLFPGYDANLKKYYCRCLPSDLFFWNTNGKIDFYPVIIAKKCRFFKKTHANMVNEDILSLDPREVPVIKITEEKCILSAESIVEPVIMSCNHKLIDQSFKHWNDDSIWEWNTVNCKWCLMCNKHKETQV